VPGAQGRQPLGLIHLYSTDRRGARPDDLEFTLAVADTVAVALENLSRRQELAENLNRIAMKICNCASGWGAKRNRRLQPAMPGDARDRPCGAESRDRADPRRKRRGQGTSRAGGAFFQPTAQRPFVCLNCAALSRSLLASELFATSKGLHRRHAAQDRQVRGVASGTLMLDEIGEMSPAIQAKFLACWKGIRSSASAAPNPSRLTCA